MSQSISILIVSALLILFSWGTLSSQNKVNKNESKSLMLDQRSVLSDELIALSNSHLASKKITHANLQNYSLVYFGETNEELYVHIDIIVYDKSHLPKVAKALESINSKQVNYVSISPKLITAYVPVVKLSALAGLREQVKYIRAVTQPIKKLTTSSQLID